MLAQTGTTGSPYSAMLRVTDNEGATATQSFSTDLLLPPVAVITVPTPIVVCYDLGAPILAPAPPANPPPMTLAYGNTLSLDGSTSYDQDNYGSGIANYAWDLGGDGTYEFSASPSYGGASFTATWAQIIAKGGIPGEEFTVNLTVVDNEDVDDMTSFTVMLDNDKPPEFLTKGETDPNVRNADTFDFFVVARALNGVLFERTLTAQDPDGTTPTWSIHGGDSGQFEIDAATGVLTFTGISSPGDSYTFQATVTSNNKTDVAYVQVTVVDAAIQIIDYTSDNGEIKRENQTFDSVAGGSFHEVEWKWFDSSPTSSYSDPLTHTMDTKVMLQVTLAGIPQGTAFTVEGKSGYEYLHFFASKAGEGVSTNVELTAEDELPNYIGQIDEAIAWTLTMNGQSIDLGSSRNLIYVTYGDPEGIVTQKRINWLTWAASGQNEIDGIVTDIQRESLRPDSQYANVPNLAPSHIWSYLDGALSECDEHVKLIEAAVKMLGVKAENGSPAGVVGYIYPKNNAINKGDFKNNDNENSEHPRNANNTEDLNYDLWYRGVDGRNHKYEAVYRINVIVNGITTFHYYAGFDRGITSRSVPYFTSETAVMEGVASGLIWRDKRTGTFGDPFSWPTQ